MQEPRKGCRCMVILSFSCMCCDPPSQNRAVCANEGHSELKKDICWGKINAAPMKWQAGLHIHCKCVPWGIWHWLDAVHTPYSLPGLLYAPGWNSPSQSWRRQICCLSPWGHQGAPQTFPPKVVARLVGRVMVRLGRNKSCTHIKKILLLIIIINLKNKNKKKTQDAMGTGDRAMDAPSDRPLSSPPGRSPSLLFRRSSSWSCFYFPAWTTEGARGSAFGGSWGDVSWVPRRAPGATVSSAQPPGMRERLHRYQRRGTCRHQRLKARHRWHITLRSSSCLPLLSVEN